MAWAEEESSCTAAPALCSSGRTHRRSSSSWLIPASFRSSSIGAATGSASTAMQSGALAKKSACARATLRFCS